MERLRRHWQSVVLLVAVVAVYLPAVTYEFVWDDLYIHLHANDAVVNFDLEALGRIFVEPYMGLYVPLTYAIWGIAWQVVPADWLAGALHLLNLLLHAGNAWIVYAVLLHLTAGRRVASLLGALVFALHPVQVEAVAWVSELRALGAACFGLLALLLTLRAAEWADRLLRPALLIALLVAAANLFKPSAVVVPLVAAALLWGFLATPWRRILLLTLPAFVAAVVVAGINAVVQTDIASMPDTGLVERLQIASFSFLHYVVSVVWPLDLSPLYGINQETAPDNWLYANALWLGPLVGLLLLAATRLRRAPLSLLFVFLVSLGPISGLIPFAFQTLAYVADRYLYWPMLAVAGAVALALALGPQPGTVRRALTAAAVLVYAILVLFVQLPIWRDEPTLWRAVIAIEGPLEPATNNLGRALRRLNDPEGAKAAYEQSLAADPDSRVALLGSALCSIELNQLDDAKALLERLIALEPRSPIGTYYLAVVQVRQGDFLEAIETLNIAVPALKSSPDPRHVARLPEAYYLRTLALVNLKEDTLAVQEAGKALELRPDYGDVLLLRAVALARLGRPEEAEADLRRARALGISFDPVRRIEALQAIIAKIEG